jgi:hypothetical protein
MKWEHWLRGLGAAFIGGGVTAVTNMVVAPESFNMSQWQHVVEAAVVSGVLNACFYLKQSPLPLEEESK